MQKKAEFDRLLTEYGFKLPVFAALGAFLLGRLPCDFNDPKSRVKLVQLFGPRKAPAFFRIHRIQKVTMVALLVILLVLISLTGKVDYSVYIFGSMLMFLTPLWIDKELDKKIKQRKRALLVDLPGFLSTLAVLVNAGLPLTAALQGTGRADEGRTERPLYQELRQLTLEVKAGRPLNQAYEDLAQRCKVPEITRFVSALLQNLNRGNADLVYVLRTLAQEAWTQRKDLARKQGEEASSKLIIPMALVFLAVTVIVLAPAVISMSNH